MKARETVNMRAEMTRNKGKEKKAKKKGEK